MVELALTPDGKWQADPPTLAAATAAAGFTALGILAQQANPAAAASFAEHGLTCHEVLALVVGDEAHTIATAEQLAAAAAHMHAQWVLAVFQELGPDTPALVKRCAAIIAEAGAGLALEPSPLGPVASLRIGRDLLAAADTDNAGLMIDTWHFAFGDNAWDELREIPLEDIAYVQFADAREPESDKLLRETLHRRAVPGEGVLELQRFVDTLRSRGYDGTVSVEVLSAELRAEPVPDVVCRLYEACARYWS